MDQADTESNDLNTCISCISDQNWSWVADDECFSFQPFLQFADPGFSEVIFSHMASFKIKRVSEAPIEERQVDHVAVDFEDVRREW